MVKIRFDFRIRSRPTQDEPLPLLCHRQPQYQVMHNSQVRMSSLNHLVFLFLMIFPLHFKKGKLVLSTLSNFVSYSHLSAFSFVHFFFRLTLGSQECIKSIVYSKLDSGDAEGNDGLKTE